MDIVVGAPITRLRLACLAAILVLFLICIGCGETFRPVANPVIPNPPNPQFAHVVLVLSGNGANNPGASTTIDVSGDTAVSQSTVGLMPAHAALVASGTRAFVANSLDDTVSQFAPGTPTPVTTISLPSSCSPNPKPCSKPVFVASTENLTVYVANSVSGTVSAISVINNVITNEIPVGINPVAMAEMPNAQKLYVANQGTGGVGGSVISINTIDKSVNPPVGASWISPVWVAARSDSQRIYVLDQGAGTVSAIDTSSDTVLPNPASVGAGANFMLYDPIRNRLYVTNPAKNTVTYLDASSDALTPVVVPIANPVSVAVLPDGSRAYVASASVSGNTVSSRVTVINAANGSIKTTIPLTSVGKTCPSTPFELFTAAAADSSRVYVGNCDAGNTAIIQTSNDTLLLNLPAPLGAGPPPNPGGPPPPQNPVFVLAGP